MTILTPEPCDDAADNPLSRDETVQATCVDPECGKPAPYKGAWCQSCQSRWEDEQRAKALRTGRANGRRGF
jgi:hypothetical protein